MNVLFRMNMVAVKYQAAFWSQKSICPISHTSLVSGCFMQNSLMRVRIPLNSVIQDYLPDNNGCV